MVTKQVLIGSLGLCGYYACHLSISHSFHCSSVEHLAEHDNLCIELKIATRKLLELISELGNVAGYKISA